MTNNEAESFFHATEITSNQLPNSVSFWTAADCPNANQWASRGAVFDTIGDFLKEGNDEDDQLSQKKTLKLYKRKNSMSLWKDGCTI